MTIIIIPYSGTECMGDKIYPMRYKYNWRLLQNEYIKGKWFTIADFFREKNIKNNSRNRTHTKGWGENKILYEKEIIAEVREKSVESEAEIRHRQQEAAKVLQQIGLVNLAKSPIDNVDTARKLVVDGLEQERRALGIEGDNIQATQINVAPAKTRLDEMIEKMNYEQLLELIAEIKRERERRKLAQQQT